MAYGLYVSNVLVGVLLPLGVLLSDTIPGFFRCTHTGRQNVEAMVTLYGPLLGIANGDLFDYVLLFSVFVALMISCWVPRLCFQSTAVIIMIWMCAYFCTVGVYMGVSQLPPGPLPFCILVPLLLFGTHWRVKYLRSTFAGKAFDTQLVGWAISCFVLVFLGLSGIILYRSSMLVASAELMKAKMEYFAEDGHGEWLVGAHEPVGFVADQTLVNSAAAEQVGLFLVPWWSAVGVLWVMFATIGALIAASSSEDSASEDSGSEDKLLE